MADVLAVSEVRDGRVRGVSREVVGAAAKLAAELGGSAHALVLGPPGVASGIAELGNVGAERIYVAEADDFGLYHPEASVRAVAELYGSGAYAAVLFPATAQGKDLAPRCAARLNCGLASDATAIEVENGGVVVTRPQYAGKAVARMTFASSPALVSLRPNVFAPEPRAAAGEVITLEVASEPRRIRVREIEEGERGKLDVAEASVVVSGGRGLQEPDHWALLEDLVDALGEGAALGASRAVVDAGWRPHSEQVGQTGKTVAPNLYFAVGISGAIQHLAGMRTANVIVAINKDPEAPIFRVADYGIVGDLFEVLPRLTEEIRAVRAAQ
jgi:electron transfer flavoprotein alpha subunit